MFVKQFEISSDSLDLVLVLLKNNFNKHKSQKKKINVNR